MLRLGRRTTALGAAYLAVVAAVLVLEALLGLRYLIVSFMAAGLLTLIAGGPLAVRVNNTAAELAEESGVAARTEAWFPVTFLCGLIAVGGLGGVVSQVRDDIVLRTRTSAVIDECRGGSAKGGTCSYHWTVGGRTYDADNGRVKGLPRGAEVAVRYDPGDPSYVLPASGGTVPEWLVGGGALLFGAVGVVSGAIGEGRAHRAYFAQVRAVAAGEG